MAADRPHEFELIKRFFAPLATDPGSLGLTDDAAVLSPRDGQDLVMTKDMLAAGAHFFPHDPADAIAQKALRVNLSDLAAKGARPRGYLLGLGLPDNWTTDWLERFCAGLAADQETYNAVLLGGDTISCRNGLQISITAIGEVPKGKAVRRSGAQPGDVLFVTGTIGDGAGGLQCRLDANFQVNHGLAPEDAAHLVDRYLLPRPRVNIADLLVIYAGAAMDISDGLFADAGHMARVSKADVKIDLDAVPVSEALQAIRQSGSDCFLRLINGGDDYEVLAAVPAGLAGAFENEASAVGCPVTRIGTVLEGGGHVSATIDGTAVQLAEQGGFRHF